MFIINHISFLRTKKVPYERAKYFFNLGLVINRMIGRGIPDRFNLLHKVFDIRIDEIQTRFCRTVLIVIIGFVNRSHESFVLFHGRVDLVLIRIIKI